MSLLRGAGGVVDFFGGPFEVPRFAGRLLGRGRALIEPLFGLGLLFNNRLVRAPEFGLVSIHFDDVLGVGHA